MSVGSRLGTNVHSNSTLTVSEKTTDIVSESETKKIEGVTSCHREKTITKKQDKVIRAVVDRVAKAIRVVIRVDKVDKAAKAEEKVAARARVAAVEVDNAVVKEEAAAAERNRSSWAAAEAAHFFRMKFALIRGYRDGLIPTSQAAFWGISSGPYRARFDRRNNETRSP